MNRTLLPVLVASLLFVSCTQYVELIYPEPVETSVKVDNGYYYFENDTIRLVYSFWGENGVMGFMIENKLSTPLFIDWQKSTLTCNNKPNSYYSEEMNRQAVSKEAASFFSRILNKNVTDKTPEQHEKMVMIPGRSYIMTSFEKLLDFGYVKLNRKKNKKTRLNNINGMLVSMGNATQSFRSNIIYSASPDFSSLASISHEFLLKRIFIINQKDFYYLDENRIFQNTMQDPRCFYTPSIKKHKLYLKS